MKRYLTVLVLITIVLAFGLTGCLGEETVPEEEKLEGIELLGDTLEKTYEIDDGIKFVTSYDTGDYDLTKWRVTDSKVINVTAKVTNVPEGASVLIKHAHIYMCIKCTNPECDGQVQGYMEDTYSGTSQDGYFVSEKYQYQNKFDVIEIEEDFINDLTYGNLYANKMKIDYKLLIKYSGEEFYHTVSVWDEFLIPDQTE